MNRSSEKESITYGGKATTGKENHVMGSFTIYTLVREL
jgi:hypothetical protein